MKSFRAYRGKVAVLLLTAVALMIGVSGCRHVSEESKNREDTLRVVTTIFPQYDFVRQIAGEHAEVSMLLKPGEETHSYEPTPQDILKIQNCDLFIYVGGENDEWVEDILESIDTEKIRQLRLIDCVETVNEEHVEGMKEERGHEHEEEDAHQEADHGSHETLTPDEHVWTSPENAISIVERITEELAGLDPEYRAVYEENKEAYEKQLEELDEAFREVVRSAKREVLLFGDRFPFRYFADAYDLDYYAAFPGCASDTEPSAATMAFLINKVKEEQIPVVLKMELSNENIANAIAETTHAEVRTFYSCHNLTAREFAEGETYLSMMKKNVETLKEALN
ncbi:MAG: metal ABC transporter substrate-binding protein [[Ruminococcus] gnavus]|nr:metal ABC transporter substrate-binding protein [Mediterraneibacter gnavus]